ncbi:hypothetical protein CPB97_007931 [Podila verticillata]|nr:hypothetical protein CPB97_007931 [Podila verticillata]
MRPPRATSGSSSAAAAAAVAMAMATAAHARFAGLGGPSSAFQFEDMDDERLRGNFRRGDERFRPGSKTDGHGSTHFNPLQRRPSASRMDDNLTALDVHSRPSRRSLQSFSSSPSSLRNLFLSPGTTRSSSISSTSLLSTSAPFGLPSHHQPRNYTFVPGSVSASSKTDPTFENYEYFNHPFSHSSNTTPSANSPIVPGGVDRQYSSSGNFAESSSGPIFSSYSSASVPSTSAQYASRSVDNLLPTGYSERPRRASPPPISRPLTIHVEHPGIYHSAPRRSASHPLLVSTQPIAIATNEEEHHQHSGRQMPHWPQNQLLGRDIPASLDSQRSSRELAPFGETTNLVHMEQSEELEDEFDLPIHSEHHIVRSNSTPAVLTTFSPAFSSTGTRRVNEQLHSPLPEQSGFHQEIPTPISEVTLPFFSSPHQFNSSYLPAPPPHFSRYTDTPMNNPALYQPRRHSEQTLSPRRQESLSSQQSQHLQYWSHGHTPQATPGSFARVRGRSAMDDDSRNIQQPFEHNFLTGQDFHSGYGSHERQLSTSVTGSMFNDIRSPSSLALPPIAPTQAARQWDIPEDHEEQVVMKQEHEPQLQLHLDPTHHVTERDYHTTTTQHQPPLSHVFSGQLYGASTSSLDPTSSATGTVSHSSATDVFDSNLALVFDDQLHLMDQLRIIHDATNTSLPSVQQHMLDGTSLAQFGSETTGPSSSHSSQAFSSRNSGTLPPPSSSSATSGASSSAMMSKSPGGGDSASPVLGVSGHRNVKIEGHDSISDSTAHPSQQPAKLGATTYMPGPSRYQQQPMAPDSETTYSQETRDPVQQGHSFVQHPGSHPGGMAAYQSGDVTMQGYVDRATHPFDMSSSSSGTFDSSQHGYGAK